MSFAAADPLADLLSDNSNENDNIFENPHPFRKVKSSSASGGNKSKATTSRLDDLFGIQEELDDRQTNAKREQSKQAAASSPKHSDDDDLGFDPKKPKGTKTTSNIFNDLLGDGASKTKKEDQRPIMSRQSTDTTTDNSNIVISQATTSARPKTSTGRRSSGMSAVMNTDPLGLFGGQNPAASSAQVPATASNLSTPRKSNIGPKKRGTTVDWLGLTTGEEATKTQSQADETSSKDSPHMQQPKSHHIAADIFESQAQQVPNTGLPVAKESEVAAVQSIELPRAADRTPKDDGVPMTFASRAAVDNMLLLNTLNLESRGASSLLEQQESQLALAAQMQQHERVLNDMMRKQDDLLKKQEQEFLAVIRQQMQRQQHMEQKIRLQQQRINAHLMLLKQPPNAFELLTEDLVNQNSSNAQEKEHLGGEEEGALPGSSNIRAKASHHHRTRNDSQSSNDAGGASNDGPSEMDLKRLDADKLRFEEMLANTKAQYEREIELLENSYRKQMELIEQQSSAIESRLKTNIEELLQFFNEKCEMLSQENVKNKSKYESQMADLKQEHANELADMRQAYLRDMDILKEEHKRMIETLRESKTLEIAMLQDGDSLLSSMNSATTNLKSIGESLVGLRDEIQTRLSEASEGKMREMQIREQRLAEAESQLKDSQAALASDNKHLRGLVTELEQKINALTKQSTVDSAELRIKINELEAERAAFERERAHHRETMQRETKRLAELKEMQLNEQKAMHLKNEEELRRLQAERARFQTSQQLEMPSAELESQKAELSAKMQAAEEAVKKANNNMSLLSQWQQKLEADRQKLLAQEEALENRERELRTSAAIVEKTEIEAKAERTRALMAQRSFEAKLKLLQQQQCALAEKESNLQNERMLIVQERIALKSIRDRMGGVVGKYTKGQGEMRGLDGTRDLLPKSFAKTINTAASGQAFDINESGGYLAGVLYSPKQNILQGRDLSSNENKNNNENSDCFNAVDRLLDRDIADSYLTMRNSLPALQNHFQATYENSASSEIDDDNVMISDVLRGLDDDSKSLALNNFTATAYNTATNDDLLVNRFEILDRNASIHMPLFYSRNAI